jgi:hypothetical protein
LRALSQIDPLFGTVKQKYARLPIYPKSHYVVQPERKAEAIDSIVAELNEWVPELEAQGRMVEAQRIHQRTRFDLEMIKSMGYCHGIENYSRHFSAGGCRARLRRRCWITFRAIFCCLWTRATRRFRRCMGCGSGTAAASRIWWITASGCRRRWTTGR